MLPIGTSSYTRPANDIPTKEAQMPVVSIMRMPGDPDDLLARMNEHLAPVTTRLAPLHGGLLNIVARDGDDGVIAINLWETEEGRHSMAREPEIQEALAAGGFPAPAFEGFEVLAVRGGERITEFAVTTVS
jgi:hypothetical protein